ncbi:hypothetical protein BJV78DRAFT_1282323 [Lactifluus subvellereus]|nr:hypothetical protein BJV78DRAFT_1282323 [Lactifluus subvellereus]
MSDRKLTHLSGDNIIAALERHDRVCQINLYDVTSSLLERLVTVTQEPFPVLTYLDLHYSSNETPSVLQVPDTFLGGFAPHLDALHLFGLPFPALPRLLLSARDLVSFMLPSVLHAGYISPGAMVTYLSVLTKLEFLTLIPISVFLPQSRKLTSTSGDTHCPPRSYRGWISSCYSQDQNNVLLSDHL